MTLSSIGDAVIASDAQAIIVFMNPAAEALTGWTLEDARGMLWSALEDPDPVLLFEHGSLQLVAMHAQRALRRTRWPLVARVVMVWCAIRHMIHDRVEPILLEGEELLVHIAPQLAAYV